MREIISCGLKFKLDCLGDIPKITCYDVITKDGQGILHFERDNTYDNIYSYVMYKWYDEGDFPESIDTVEDISRTGRNRLKITGVDEV